MKVLIIEDEEDLLELLQFEVESTVSAQVLLALDGQQGIDLLQANPDIALVVSDYNMPRKNGGQVFQFMRSIQHQAQFILCSARDPHDCPEFTGNPPDGYAAKPNLSEVGKLIESLIDKATQKSFAPKVYNPISIHALARINALNCDVYVRLSEAKYVRIIKKGDTFTQEDLEKYGKRDLLQVYISQSDATAFVDFLSKEIDSLLQTKNLPLESSLELSKTTLESVHSLIQTVGMSNEAQELTRKSVDLSLRILSSNHDITLILKKLTATERAYIIEHSLGTGYLACHIASLMEWTSESTLFKLMLASQIHDVTLGIFNLSRLKELDLRRLGHLKELSPEEKSFFLSHPLQAAALSREFSLLPPEVDAIIAQHHERPDGSGFPNSLNEVQISPLSSVLIVAHDLYTAITEDGKSVLEFCENYPQEFKVGTFKKIIEALRKSAVTPSTFTAT